MLHFGCVTPPHTPTVNGQVELLRFRLNQVTLHYNHAALDRKLSKWFGLEESALYDDYSCAIVFKIIIHGRLVSAALCRLIALDRPERWMSLAYFTGTMTPSLMLLRQSLVWLKDN